MKFQCILTFLALVYTRGHLHGENGRTFGKTCQYLKKKADLLILISGDQINKDFRRLWGSKLNPKTEREGPLPGHSQKHAQSNTRCSRLIRFF